MGTFTVRCPVSDERVRIGAGRGRLVVCEDGDHVTLVASCPDCRGVHEHEVTVGEALDLQRAGVPVTRATPQPPAPSAPPTLLDGDAIDCAVEEFANRMENVHLLAAAAYAEETG